MTRFVLASRSPARLSVLRGAGIDPLVRVSNVDEDEVAASLGPAAKHPDVVIALAEAKANVIASSLLAGTDAVVIGCDSMLSIDGHLVGKPADIGIARQRWTHMAGRVGNLLTGHAIIRIEDGAVSARASAVSSTSVFFGRPSAEDLESYLATGEPLEVAGAFTLDGLGGWFVDRIEGDPSSVIGIGLPLVRTLVAEVGVSVSSLWRDNPVR